jgi:hypothetical protein
MEFRTLSKRFALSVVELLDNEPHTESVVIFRCSSDQCKSTYIPKGTRGLRSTPLTINTDLPDQIVISGTEHPVAFTIVAKRNKGGLVIDIVS